MTCRLIDGFDYYSTGDITGKWTTKGLDANVSITAATVRNGTGALRIVSHASQGICSVSFDDQASWIIGFGFYTDAIHGGSVDRILHLIDNGAAQLTLRINIDSTLEVLRSSSTAVAGGKSTLTINAETWYYIELKCTIANSIASDSCIVNVNDVEYINVDAAEDLQATANATADSIALMGRIASGPTHYFDDVYIFDGTGSDNVDFAGDSKVLAHYPDGTGTINDFTGSDADSIDNHLLVDEVLTDDDTSYVESSGVADIDLYTFDDFAVPPNTIHAVQINMVTKKDDAGARTIRSIIRPISTNIEGDSKSPSDGSYSNEIQIYDLNPEITGVWTEAAFNATEFGIKIQS